MPQDEKEDSPNEKALTAFTVRAFSFQSRGRNLNVWPPRSPLIREQPEPLRSIRANERPDGTDGVLL